MTTHKHSFEHHFVTIDLLKSIAVQFIIFHHISNYGPIQEVLKEWMPNLVDWFSFNGRFAVQVFLVIGGYLAAKNLPRTLEKFKLPRTIINRYLRLMPTYFVALIVIMICAWLARHIHYEEYIGHPQTIQQVVAHLFLIEHLLKFESISVGVWYVAIDWQLYIFLAILLAIFKSNRNILFILSVFITVSLMYFGQKPNFENYFLYFIGAYGLGAIAFMGEDTSHVSTQKPARILLILFSILILSDTFFEIRIKNVLEIILALLLTWLGNVTYGATQLRGAWICVWFSQRSYSAFLIHFSTILLGNSIFYWFNISNPYIAMVFVGAMWLTSWVFANLLYKFVEYPSRNLQLR